MCTYSMIADHYDRDLFPRKFPDYYPDLIPNRIPETDLAEIRKELQEMKLLLQKAIEYDKKNNQADCQDHEKIVRIKKLAEIAGIDLSDVLIEMK